MRSAWESCFLKTKVEEIKCCCSGTVSSNTLQKPCHCILHTLVRHKLRDLCLNGFMVIRGSHMKVTPFPARQNVLPGDNQDFLPETVDLSA